VVGLLNFFFAEQFGTADEIRRLVGRLSAPEVSSNMR
jgi:hypothetical protein